jgi:hypothetical protein
MSQERGLCPVFRDPCGKDKSGFLASLGVTAVLFAVPPPPGCPQVVK